jgi:hypothetical protein
MCYVGWYQVGRVMRAHPLTRFALLFYLTIIHLMITFQLAWVRPFTKKLYAFLCFDI